MPDHLREDMCKKCYEEALVNNLYNMCDENRLDDVKARNRLSKYEIW